MRERSELQKTSVVSLLSRNDTLIVEVLWALEVVTGHFSHVSFAGVGYLFRQMFPDSTVASHFGLSERKCSYLCCFGIAPYVRDLLKKHVRSQPSFVLLFNESLNKKSKVQTA